MVGKEFWQYRDFAFNDSDPEKMTAYDKYMYDNYYSIGTDDDPMEEGLIKKCKVN
jgi:hypothetical protein